MPHYAHVNWVDALAYVVWLVFIIATIDDVVRDTVRRLHNRHR